MAGDCGMRYGGRYGEEKHLPGPFELQKFRPKPYVGSGVQVLLYDYAHFARRTRAGSKEIITDEEMIEKFIATEEYKAIINQLAQ